MSDWVPEDYSGALPTSAINALFAACVKKYGDKEKMILKIGEIQDLIPRAGGISITRVDDQFEITVGDMDEVDAAVRTGHAYIVKPGD